MPFVNIRMVEGPATKEQKAEIAAEITSLLQRVLGKNPQNTHIAFEEFDPENWAFSGKLVKQLREEQE